MSQITLTLDLTHEMVNALHALVDALPAKMEQISYTNQGVDETTPSEKSGASTKEKKEPAKPKNDKAKDTPPADVKTDTPPASDAPSKTDVRAIALKLSKAGKQDVLKKIFAKYDAEKLSGVAESDYPALMKDLEAANAEV